MIQYDLIFQTICMMNKLNQKLIKMPRKACLKQNVAKSTYKTGDDMNVFMLINPTSLHTEQGFVLKI